MPGTKLTRSLAVLVVVGAVMSALAVSSVSATPNRSTGLFVLGDATVLQATATDTVTWWSHSWWTENSLSGGLAPASFKGFATEFSSDTPTCGDTWTTGPGNSPHPPEDVPPVITVLVASSVTKSGSEISGDIVQIVQVATDPGYGPNPGHPGTGRIVATLCGGDE